MQRHESYKPSGVKWIGDVPAHWDVRPGFTCFDENKDRNKRLTEKTVLSLSYGRIIVKSEEKMTGLVPESFDTYQLIKPGDIVIRTTDLQNDKTSLRVGLARDKGMITSAYLGLRCKPEINPEYVFRLLESYDALKIFYGMGSGLRQNIDFWDFKRLPIPTPPRVEQDRIVAFLDQKTAEIESAIAKKERLIELLQEQKGVAYDKVIYGSGGKTALIETGNDFIPLVGRGVEVIQLVRLCKKIADGPHFSPPYVEPEDGYIFLSAGNIRPNKFLLDDVKYVSERHFKEFSKRVRPERGDVLYTKGGTTGVAKAVDLDMPFQVWVHIAVLKLRHNMVDPQYLAYALNSSNCYAQSQLFTRGATNKDLGLTRMKNIDRYLNRGP
jgi:type I restriction enzyme, S subunit